MSIIEDAGLDVLAGLESRQPVHPDEQWLRALYEQYAGALFGYVLQQVRGDRFLAEDVVQETLLRAWTHPEAFHPDRGSPRAWLFAVARNLLIDQARTRRSRPRELGDAELSETWAERLLDPSDDVYDQRLDALCMTEALDALSEDHRAVLIETFYRGASVAEAAQRLGVPRGTVKSRTHYALRALRTVLAHRGLT